MNQTVVGFGGSRMSDSCPCVHAVPCHDRCTCVNPLSSSGCRRCCSYGSEDQQRAMAEHLVLREMVFAAAMRRHRAGDFSRTMPTSGADLIAACDAVMAREKSQDTTTP